MNTNRTGQDPAKNQGNKPHPAPDPTKPNPSRPDTRIPVKPDEDNDFTQPKEPVKEPQNKPPMQDPDQKNQTRKDAPGEKNKEGNTTVPDPTSKGDPGRIDPSGPGNPALSPNILTTWFIMLIIAMFMFPVNTSAKEKREAVKTEVSAEAQVLINRLEEIKNMDKSELQYSEKRALRKEVREIKEKLATLSGGVYLSVGAIIIIILLLILLL